jgi:hypothetical protein
MIRTVLLLRVQPDQVATVLDTYRTEGILEYSLEHSECLASELSVATDGSGEVLVTALWLDIAAYEGWLNNPWRGQSSTRLAEMLVNADVGAGRTYRIVHSVGASGSPADAAG